MTGRQRRIVSTHAWAEPAGAAALLGLKPTTLESRLKKLGLQRPR